MLANPHDPVELARTCYFALNMHPGAAGTRLREAFEIVGYYDIGYWGEDFMAAIGEIRKNTVIDMAVSRPEAA